MRHIDLIEKLRLALSLYKADVDLVFDYEEKLELSNIIKVVDDIIGELEGGKVSDAIDDTFRFSRVTSDAFSVQPPSFKPLASIVGEIRNLSV